MPDINGIPYVESSDLVSAYPAASQALAQEVSDQLASKPTFTYGTATPTADAEGAIWYDENDTPPTPKFWDGSAWQPFSSGLDWAVVSSPSATGQYTDGNGDTWDYYTFTASGTLTVSTEGQLDALVVAGGGCGGNDGGGGGGGVCRQTISLSAGTYTVTVGAGGTPPSSNWSGVSGTNFNQTNSGKPSAFANLAAVGGGGGAYVSASGGAGGSSGGPARDSVVPGVLIAGNQGNLGEAKNNGAGGGAGGAGGSTDTGQGGPGADHSDIKGNAAGTDFYGGGGAGRIRTGSPPNGATDGNTSGAANSGAGGGASLTNGGSGIVIVRVKV